ncbi:hypothetical protein F7725_005398, partial [Dissostichus mawsoni]
MIRVQEHLTYHSLEARVEVGEEGWLVLLGQDSLLHHGTFNIIVLNHHVLLQDLYCEQLFSALHFCQHDLYTRKEKSLSLTWFMLVKGCGLERPSSVWLIIFLPGPSLAFCTRGTK